MIKLRRYTFDVGYPKPLVDILAYSPEEAVEKLKKTHPEVKWFQMDSYIETIETTMEEEDYKKLKEKEEEEKEEKWRRRRYKENWENFLESWYERRGRW